MVAIFPASTTGGGQALGFPDVCKTPAPPAPSPVPMPYPNTGQCAQATKQCNKVRASGRPVLNLKSEIPMSQGDEPGVAGGVVSNRNMDKVVYKKGSGKVRFKGQSAVYHTSMTGHNGSNANMPAGAQIAPSQTKVRVSP